ncbi:MAG: sodium-translocating pyrophosphatase [Chloroflexi bacterium]|nr:sodium-translocating pyrophosphatase [Chloroflexota bacterium]MBK6712137.1 sodium-translocating pyrophosphatase [Chloroflexota bacterium]MBP6805816.1 sodium-translocating pyrophosphatase [Chloroflexota bacterium]MBP7590988.1 sodium-translocating pyrophosphatase [Chloroflexota bacterium]
MAQDAVSGRTAVPLLWWLGPIGALIALGYAYYFYRQVMAHNEGTPRMIEIAQAVREGAMAYLTRQYRVVGIVFAVLFVVFLIMSFLKLQNPVVPFAFITGGLFSAVCGFFGMKTATNASARTAHAASQSLNNGLQVALRAGAVMGLVVVGFALLDITAWFLILYYAFPVVLPNSFISTAANPLPIITATMLSFGMGASTQALFARVGGGIFTKAADVGADLVGKVEAGIPEDDPRNPATIADNVGDNVGDVAGMGADLYESYAGSILATSALGVAAVATAGTAMGGFTIMELQLRYLSAPIVLAAVGVVLSIMAIYLVQADEGASQAQLIGALSRGLYGSSIGIAVLSLPVLYTLGLPNWWQVWTAVVTGLVVGIIVGKATEYYTSHAFKPTRGIAAQAETSSATALIEGLAVGMESNGIPVIAIVFGIAVSFYVVGGNSSILMGLYGVGIAAVGMLSTLGFTLATDAYGPIADNAGGNAEMAELDPKVRDRTDQLDAVGNTTAAIGKGFAIGSAALTSLALLAAYLEEIRLVLTELRGIETVQIAGKAVAVATMTMQDFMIYYNVTLLNPAVLIGLFIGAATAFYFSALTMRAVGRAAGGMVEEVRRQFRSDPGILAGTSKPDYARCVDISTASAQREMVTPSVIAIAVPVIVGILFGVAGVLGLLSGGLAAGFALAVMMANAGGSWDNAKKYIEEGHHGGKGSQAHKAAVVGDTVGDPFKDTSGPSLNILIKLMSMVSVVFAGLVVAFAGGQGLLYMLVNGG